MVTTWLICEFIYFWVILMWDHVLHVWARIFRGSFLGIAYSPFVTISLAIFAKETHGFGVFFTFACSSVDSWFFFPFSVEMQTWVSHIYLPWCSASTSQVLSWSIVWSERSIWWHNFSATELVGATCELGFQFSSLCGGHQLFWCCSFPPPNQSMLQSWCVCSLVSMLCYHQLIRWMS